ncbi:MAG: hypothetical protein HOI95_08085, partial [Chromatiales bacterium]|nr:hypothetical protein [Chromatiales bacterium]
MVTARYPHWIGLCVSLALSCAVSMAYASDAETTRQFTFSWPFEAGDELRPRGGNTKGPAVTLAPAAGDAWQRLQAKGISPFERDRQAILAMAGSFRTTFDFLETAGFGTQFKPDRPYQSWATERVYVAADEGTLISLQHIIVMFFSLDDGTVQGPMVVKHWRHDWRYEDADLHVHEGRGRWSRRRLGVDEVKGTWSQAVFQVDDSPRYEGVGRWQHLGNYSAWQSGTTWRPLPRREFSVRSDYDVLSGTNRHAITPTGWIHEEDNLKVVLNTQAKPPNVASVVAREVGLNRYEHIVDHDFSGGDGYWNATHAFWAEVRSAWHRIFERRD